MTIMPSVEGQCELSIKQAVNIDLVDQEQSNQYKSDIRFYFVSISDFFIIITEKSKCIGELFIPSYTGYEQFQDSVRFSFFFRVRDSTGYDVVLRPPERLRKRFFSKIRSIGDMIDDLNKQGHNIEPIKEKFECKLKGKPDQAVNVLIEDNFINIFDSKQHIYLDKVDLTEPDIYVDGFHGFEHPPKNPTVYLYTNNQLRQTLEFGEKRLDDAQRFMKTVARGSAKYCDNSHHSLIKNDLEIKNNDFQNDSSQEDINSRLNKKSSFSGINEFYEEPKYTKFPQGAKQKLKNSLRNQLKVKKTQFEQSKKDLRDLHAAQKQISIQQAQQQQPQSKPQNQTESKILRDDDKISQEKLNQQQFQNADLYIETESQELKESSEIFESEPQILQQKPMSFIPRQKSTILLNTSIVEKSNSQPFDIKQSPSTPIAYPPNKLLPPLPLQQQQRQQQQQPSPKNLSPTYQKMKQLQQQQQQIQMQIQSPQPPPPPNLQRSPAQQQQETKAQQSPSKSESLIKPQKKTSFDSQDRDLSFFKEETEEEIAQNYNEVIEMEENDLEKIQIIVKSYLMLNYRNNYLKDKNDKPNLKKGLSNDNSILDVDYQDEKINYFNSDMSTTEISDFMNKAKDDFKLKSPHLSTFKNLANALITKNFEFKKPNDDQQDFLSMNADSSSDYSEEVIEDFNTDSYKSSTENIKENDHIRIDSNDEKFISENEDENKNKSNTDNKDNIIKSLLLGENSDSENKSAVADDEKSNSNSASQSDEDESKTLNSDNENNDNSKSNSKNDSKSKSNSDNDVNKNTESSTKNNNNNTDEDDSNYYENDQLSNSNDSISSADDASSTFGMKLIKYIQEEIEKKFDIYDMILKLVIKKVLKKDKKEILSNFLAQAYKFGSLHYVFIIIYNINCRLPFEKKEFMDDFDGTCFTDDKIIRLIINSLATTDPENISLGEMSMSKW